MTAAESCTAKVCSKLPFHQMFRPGCKVWVERGGSNFGGGLYYLLLQIQEQGSLSRAAKTMGMSYRAAWGKIKTAEKKWGFKLVETQVGGDTGGGTHLTVEGMKLIESFGKFRDRVERLLEEAFRESFES